MGRKIWSMTLMVLSAIFLIASVIGVGTAWYYNDAFDRGDHSAGCRRSTPN